MHARLQKLRAALRRTTHALKREIASCRRVEDALRRSREEVEMILDSSPAMIFYKDRRNRFVRVNRAFADALGRPREEIEGAPVASLFPRHAAKYRRDDRAVIASGRPRRAIVEQMETGRGLRWLRTDKIPCRDRRGRITGVIGFAVDITELLAIEREREHLASFPRLNPCPVLEVSDAGEVRYCNPAGLLAVWRLRPRSGIRAFVPPDLPVLFRGLDGKPRKRAYREVRIGPRLFGENLNWIPRYGTLRIYAFDITARRGAEARIRAYGERLDGMVRRRTLQLGRSVVRLRAEIARRREIARQVQCSNDLLRLLGKSSSRREYLEGVVRLLKKISGCRCAGVRLAGANGEIPYEASSGFSAAFLKEESRLVRGRDRCTCVRIIAGTPAPHDAPALTARGSFHLGDTGAFLRAVPARARELYRGACARSGLVSLAVVPIRDGKRIIGAIHLADRRKGAVSAPIVALVESLALLVGEGVRKFSLEDRIEREHASLDAFFTHTITPLVFLDRKFNFIRVNEAYARACGHPVSFFPGKNHFALYPSDTRALFEKVVRTKMPFQVAARAFTFADHPEWGVTYWDWSLVPILDRRGEIDFLVFSLNNVTDRVRAQEELLKAHRSLEESRRLSDIGTLASIIAHELRNPLGVIRLAAHNIRRKSPDRSLDAHLSSIDKKIDESDQIINNLLFYSRIRSPQPAPVAITALLDECVAQSWRRHGRPGVRVSKRYRALRGCVLRADQVQLRELFNNLLNNAYEAIETPRGGIEIAGVRDPETGAVEIRVGDSGRGISPGDLPRVQEPFFTTKSRGTGLGLTVCYQVAALHGGSIRVESAPGRGAVFTVSLPSRAPDGGV